MRTVFILFTFAWKGEEPLMPRRVKSAGIFLPGLRDRDFSTRRNFSLQVKSGRQR